MTTETKVGLFTIIAIGIFIYMTFHIGVFRFNSSSFRSQKVYFTDVSGLAKKADVKIAGVKVGWVSRIDLTPNREGSGYSACAEIMVSKEYRLHEDAYALIRQDGLLGVKFLELVPGDPLSPILHEGVGLGKSGKPIVAVDDIMSEFKNVASNINEITTSLKNAMNSDTGRSRMSDIMDDVQTTTSKLANFTTTIDRIISHNEKDVDGLIKDLRTFASQLKDELPQVATDVHKLSSQLTDETLPNFSKNVDTIAQVFDGDIASMARKIDSAADSLEEAALQTRDGFRSIGSVADKINDGKGLVGKLINEDQTYNDLKVAISGLKNYFSKAETLSIVVDSHLEAMYAPAENFDLKDSKGYVDLRIHNNEDHFYVLQMMGSTKGKLIRKDVHNIYYDDCGTPLDIDKILATANTDDIWAKFEYAPHKRTIIQERDAVKYGFQFGKIFNDVALRFGLFESSFGCAIDYDIPFDSDDIRWVTSVEMFDLRGRDRIDDQRPHIKWVNRVFLLRNFYIDFGADDFVSRHNANAFFGMGIRFADDDLKYFLARFGSGIGS